MNNLYINWVLLVLIFLLCFYVTNTTGNKKKNICPVTGKGLDKHVKNNWKMVIEMTVDGGVKLGSKMRVYNGQVRCVIRDIVPFL